MREDCDRVVFVVEAVLEIDTSQTPVFLLNQGPAKVVYRTLWRGSFLQWSFPDTKEARSIIRSEPL